MYRESRLQRLERELKGKTLKERVLSLWDELRRVDEEKIATENKLADLRDAVQDVILFNSSSDIEYLKEVYEKQKVEYEVLDEDDGEIG